MPTPFIRYTPDIEAADPRFDETLQTVIAKTEQYIAASVTAEGDGTEDHTAGGRDDLIRVTETDERYSSDIAERQYGYRCEPEQRSRGDSVIF
jgi:hypothetical protein